MEKKTAVDGGEATQGLTPQDKAEYLGWRRELAGREQAGCWWQRHKNNRKKRKVDP
jgi:hypothetical protein